MCIGATDGGPGTTGTAGLIAGVAIWVVVILRFGADGLACGAGSAGKSCKPGGVGLRVPDCSLGLGAGMSKFFGPGPLCTVSLVKVPIGGVTGRTW